MPRVFPPAWWSVWSCSACCRDVRWAEKRKSSETEEKKGLQNGIHLYGNIYTKGNSQKTSRTDRSRLQIEGEFLSKCKVFNAARWLGFTYVIFMNKVGLYCCLLACIRSNVHAVIMHNIYLVVVLGRSPSSERCGGRRSLDHAGRAFSYNDGLARRIL